MIVTRLPVSLPLVLSLAFAACGGEGLTLPPEGEAAHITVVDGSPQSGRVGSPLSKPLLVEVTDTRGRLVSGATVVFSFSSPAQGEAIPDTTTTNSEGRAATTLKLGSAPGTITGKAEVPVAEGITPVEATFTVTALPDDANGIAPLSGGGETAPVNSTLPAPLVVEVTDEFGNPIAGVAIAWTVTGGGSVSAATTDTDASGQASVTRTLGGTAGEQTTIATAGGLAGSPVTFTHTATAGSASGVVKVDGDDQSALVGTELAEPLVVQVLDELGNPIPNRDVTWVTGDGSVNPENTTTDAQGHASTRWTLGPTPGAKTATAVVSGVGTATFNATATAGSPSASTSTVTASPTTINAGGSSTITVTVRDDANNPVGGVSVSVASSGSENTISPATASTGSNGVATFTFSSTLPETKTITATAGGVAITDVATITVQKVGSIIEITSDEPDPSVVGETVRVEFTVTGNGGTPTGDVTVTVGGGSETCTGTLSGGTGFCDITLAVPGNRRVITASYAGDARFSGDTDTENHRVDLVPVANTPPTAEFGVSCSDLSCTFTDESTDPDNDLVSWSWDFGDGTGSTERNPPSHTYAAAGSYTVRLTVRDDNDASDEHTETVTVTAPPPPNSTPTSEFSQACDTPTLTCTFVDESTDPDNDIVSWTWDFGDGTTSTEQNPPPHAYAPGGPYTVTLTVTDDNQASSTHEEPVTFSP